MATKVYVAISATSRTGDAVTGGEGATYAATFANMSSALSDATYGPRDLATLDEQQIYEIFLDVSPLDEQIDMFGYSGSWVVTASTNVILRAEANSKHDGTPFNGVELTGGSPVEEYGLSMPDYSLLEDVNYDGAGKYSSGIKVQPDSTIRRCIIKGRSQGINIEGPDRITVESCIIRDTPTKGLYFSLSSGSKVHNTIIYNSDIDVRYNDVEFINCVAVDSEFDTSDITASSSNNASTDTSATAASPGGGDIINLDASAAFTDHLSYDFTLAAGSPLEGSGFDLSSTSIRDITGQLFEVPFPMGIFQPGEFTVPVELSNVPLGTEVRIFDNDSNAELVGVESSAASPVVLDMPYPGVPVNTRIVLLNMNYRYQVLTTEIGPNGLSFPVTLARDRVYKNP